MKILNLILKDFERSDPKEKKEFLYNF